MKKHQNDATEFIRSQSFENVSDVFFFVFACFSTVLAIAMLTIHYEDIDVRENCLLTANERKK